MLHRANTDSLQTGSWWIVPEFRFVFCVPWFRSGDFFTKLRLEFSYLWHLILFEKKTLIKKQCKHASFVFKFYFHNNEKSLTRNYSLWLWGVMNDVCISRTHYGIQMRLLTKMNSPSINCFRLKVQWIVY